ncbi:Mannitol-1-phosphate 5-dehydrogenase [Methanimicrococcus hongohii]|uniref:Mannitol-1-phosphate 5-dehydrogenase n=1 Tax=Methanimicrococcus hongohii TaxID=3028295 RepID=A0AA96V0E1_9EURY|nr:2-dehydropantoate 2-reductase N-terminal domain-containing protein [Methanimicrococcus sp. Hf6]WNY23458.1 Mannitol-1-phosphate 5-dehydrogenase [Methanimicrococcus sp. Hf6]
MTAKEIIAIIGAGAIGRGFLPWKINTNKYDLVFVDINPEIVNGMNKNGGFLTFKSHNGKLEEKFVRASRSCLISEFKAANYTNLAAVFVAVGPSNVKAVADCLKGVSGSIILCENDPETVELLKADLGTDNVYFAIPDVIASNTASSENLLRDELAIHTENGKLFVDDRANRIDGDIEYISVDELLNKEWEAKLFLHNTPHCIAAYLGAMYGMIYLHEVMEHPELRETVSGSMNEMLSALKNKNGSRNKNGNENRNENKNENDHAFLDQYAAKEIERFSDKLLCDPISRVAREPYRKLQPNGRLIGAVKLCHSAGVSYDNIMIGIAGAALYAYREEFGENEATHCVSDKEKISHVFAKIGLINQK